MNERSYQNEDELVVRIAAEDPEIGDIGPDPGKEKKKHFFQFAAMSWTYWWAACFGSYLTVFLQSIGWRTTQVGIMNSINSAVGIVSTPFWGTLSDKIKSIKKILLPVIIASAITFALIPMMDYKIAGISILFIVVPISGFFRVPVNSLIDNWTVRACNKEGLHFGAIRSFGSVSFGIIGMILGYVVPKINEAHPNRGTILTFFGYGFFMIALLFVIASIKEDLGNTDSGRKHLKFREMNFGALFRNYYYITYLIYAMLIQVPLACVYSFQPYLLKELNINTGMIGYLTGFKAFIEVPMLLLMDKVRNKVPLYYLLFGSGVLYMVEALFYSYSTNFIGIMFIGGVLQGLAGGLHIAAGSNYVATLAPADLKATAQTLNGSMVSIAGMIGNVIGGIITDRIGVRAFYRICAIIILIALTLYILSFPFGEKVLKKPKPQIVKHGDGK